MLDLNSKTLIWCIYIYIYGIFVLFRNSLNGYWNFIIFNFFVFLFFKEDSSQFGLVGQTLGPHYGIAKMAILPIGQVHGCNKRALHVHNAQLRPCVATSAEKKAYSVKMLTSARSTTIHVPGLTNSQ
jgi:hypothetical protein